MPVQERATFEWARFLTDRIVDVASGRGTSAFEALDRASPEQIDRLWHRYLLAQMVS